MSSGSDSDSDSVECLSEDDNERRLREVPLAQDPSPELIPETQEVEESEPEPESEKPAKRKRRSGGRKLGEPKPKKSKAPEFRLQAMRVFLTYKGHVDKTNFVEWIRSKRKVKWIRIAHESGDEKNPYLHSHVLVEFDERKNWKNPRCLDYSNDGQIVHPNIEVIRSKKHWENTKNYLAKEDPDNADLKKAPTILTVMDQKKTYREFMEEALERDPENWKSANALKTIWDNAGFKMEPFKSNWKPCADWHETLLQFVEEQPDARKIIWIFDKIGNTGKTRMAKYLYQEDPEKWLVTKDMGVSRDAATIVKNALETGWTGWGMILDLPRTAETNKTRIYQYLEEIKDGFVTAQKYQGGTCLFQTPHVVVFANWAPFVKSLSMDRWEIYEIRDGELEAVSTDECLLINAENETKIYQ
jgi:hypothetical protein